MATRTRAKSGCRGVTVRGNGEGRRPWAAPQSFLDHHRPGPGHGLGMDGGQSALQILPGLSPGVSRELTLWSTPTAEGPRPGYAPQGKPNTAEPHPGPHLRPAETGTSTD